VRSLDQKERWVKTGLVGHILLAMLQPATAVQWESIRPQVSSTSEVPSRGGATTPDTLAGIRGGCGERA
jgi:hypothetical protein